MLTVYRDNTAMKTIALLLYNAADRKLLTREIVHDFDDFTVIHELPPLGHPLDLIILDKRELPHRGEQVSVLKDASAPLFLPCLLLSPDSPSRFSGELEVVDDVLTIPISKEGLRLRINQNLRIRDLTLTLREHSLASLYQANRELEESITRLKKTQQQVIEQERLRALGQMASGIAHDFNNQLSILSGYCQVLLMKLGTDLDPEYLRTKLTTMLTASEDASKIVSRLRKFYRARDVDDKFTSLDLNGLVEECVEMTRPRWEREARKNGQFITVETDLEPKALIVGDAQELRESIINLILNAVQAMPDGGDLLISTRDLGADGVQLSIRDTGTGMDETTRRRCLEPFFTTKGVSGTGLGLSVVKGIMERHEAKLEVVSAPGEGTDIYFYFPSRRSEVPSNAPSEVAREVTAQRILLVDDEEAVSMVVEELLRSDGHEVVVEHDGTTALERLKKESFSLMITDLSMPRMNGDSLSKQSAALFPEMPIIMLTGFGALMDVNASSPNGVDQLLSKPVDFEELRQAIREFTSKVETTTDQTDTESGKKDCTSI